MKKFHQPDFFIFVYLTQSIHTRAELLLKKYLHKEKYHPAVICIITFAKFIILNLSDKFTVFQNTLP